MCCSLAPLLEGRALRSHIIYSKENPEFSAAENEDWGLEGILEIVQSENFYLITDETEAQEVSTVSSRVQSN